MLQPGTRFDLHALHTHEDSEASVHLGSGYDSRRKLRVYFEGIALLIALIARLYWEYLFHRNDEDCSFRNVSLIKKKIEKKR